MVKQPEDSPAESVFIFTDGSCSPNPGPGGWAALILWDQDAVLISGSQVDTTNNRMELRAILEALEFLDSPRSVILRTDNQYAKGVLQDGWDAKKNLDLIRPTKERMEDFDVSIEWVEAHSGIPYNELVDDACREARKSREEFQIDRSPVGSSTAARSSSAGKQVKKVGPAVVVGKTVPIQFLGERIGEITPLPLGCSKVTLDTSYEEYPLLEELAESHGATTITFEDPAHVALAHIIDLAGAGLEGITPDVSQLE